MAHNCDTETVCENCGKPFMVEKYRIVKGLVRYCSMNCYREVQRKPENQRAMLDSKTVKSEGCWTFTGCIAPNGYGRCCKMGAHRLAYILAYGPIPDGMLICHKCDNRRCVRPDHLFVGTYSDNNKDSANKLRNSVGSLNAQSVLTEADVIELRRLYANREMTQAQLAKRYGVNQTNISMIVTRQTWKHI